MKAILKSGRTIDYDTMVEHVESHPNDPKIVVTMCAFSRGKVGVVFVTPKHKIERIEK